MTGVTNGAGTTLHSGAPEFTPCFSGVHVARSLVFCVVFCRSFFFFAFVPFPLAIVSVLLRFTDPYYVPLYRLVSSNSSLKAEKSTHVSDTSVYIYIYIYIPSREEQKFDSSKI